MKTKTSNTAVAVVGNYKFLIKHLNKFIFQLRQNGKFNDDLVVITNYSVFTYLIQILIMFRYKNITFLRFNNIIFSENAENSLKNLNTGSEKNRHIYKNFQWHKINLFDEKLKKWQFIFYIDINMIIHMDINPILTQLPNNKLFARADGYPEFERIFLSQFDISNKNYDILQKIYDMQYEEYFQSGILYYDTNLINSNTKKHIIDLVEKFPISLTNEQAIFNLYFHFTLNVYEQLEIEFENILNYYYWMVEGKKVRITKQNRIKYK